MTAITFPNSPSSGDTHTAGNGIVYTYDGEKWTSIGTNSAGTWTRSGTEVSLTNAGDDLNVDSGTLFVDASTDRVGVGTSSPSTRLHVSSADASATYLRAENTGGYALFGVDSSGNAYAGAETNDAFGLVTNGSYRMYITSAGNVGIGTTSPSRQLDVNSTAIFDVNGDGTTTSPSIAIGSNGVGLSYIGSQQLAFLTNSSEKARIDSSGRLLVGTSSATYGSTLKLQGNSDSTFGEAIVRACRGTSSPTDGQYLGNILFSDNSELPSANIIAARDGGTWSASSKPGRLVFSTTADGASSPTERMRIASDGRATFQGVVDLSGSTSYLQGQEGYIDFRSTSYGVAIRSALSDILIYTTNTAGVVLNNGATAFSPFTSESRLKDIVADCDYTQAWDLVKDIQLKRYFYKDQDDDFRKARVSYLGPMADWLEKQDPELIIYQEPDDDGPVRSFNQGLLDMKALAALSAALKRIEALEAKVAALEAS